MIAVRSILLISIILIYGWVFNFQEKRVTEKNVSLTIALPASFYTIVSGYMKQLAAEILFIRTGIFLGGVLPGTPPTSYEVQLKSNFDAITKIYPFFIDSYYYCQAFLPHISTESAVTANNILERGIAAYPNNFVLRFFYASNYFLAMNEPLKGSAAFAEAAKLPNAPPMFGHLAALLSAQGGDIAAGLMSLKAMLVSEKDPVVQTRYEEEIAIFEKALDVQKAIKAYIDKHGTSPLTLDQLVPEFIKAIPEINDSFVLVYDPPNLHLQRPDRMKKVEKGVSQN